MGDSYAWPDNFVWNPHAWLSPLLKLNRYVLTYATHKVSNPRGTQSVHKDPFGWCNRLPMCSFLWGTAMHGRTPVHGTPYVSLFPLSKHKEQVETHAKHMVNNPRGMLPTHLHAFERRDKLGMCGFSWGTAMHGRTTLHGTPMHGCPPYWNSIDMC